MRTRRKVPIAALAGVGVLAIAAVVATLVLRGKTVDGGAPTAAVMPAAPGDAGAVPAGPRDVPTTAAAPTVSAAATAGAAAMPPDTPMPAAAAPAHSKPAVGKNERDRERERTTRTAKLATPAPAPASEPARASSATPSRAEPEPAPVTRPAPPPVASSANANFAAVDACRDKLFILREMCLNEACAKPGARSHPACVRHREEVHLREEGKVRQGPQQLP
jgi:eukaryotic-like serine/threonine-protein kinase